jgi:hypothetical protein
MRESKIEISRWLFFLGLACASFHVLPAFFQEFISRSLTLGDVIDFATPWVVIPAAFFVFSRIFRIESGKQLPSGFQIAASKILLGAGFILYVGGHGLHLSANSIARLIDKAQNPELFHAVYLWDEIISHYMWDAGVYLIAIAMIVASFRRSHKSLSVPSILFISVGALLYGFTFAVNSVEGQTIVFAIPAAIFGGAACVGLRWKNSRPERNNPVTLFFLVAYSITLILLVYLGIRYPGFPQFSELGWI